VRIDGAVFFGSVQPVADVIERMGSGAQGRRHLLIVASGINYLDAAGAHMLVHQARLWAARGGALYICALRFEARTFFPDCGYADEFGPDNIFTTKAEAIAAIFEHLERPICERCSARIFEECARVPRPGRSVDPIET
jgi:SulP family sulfate permease